MPFTYRQVKDLYDVLHGAGAVSKSLPDWSNEMNALSGGDLYSAGINDNFIKQSSVALDRALEAIPGLTEGSRQLGAGFGGLFGQEEAGARIGEGLPRMAANFLPVIAGSLVTGPAAPFVAGAGLLGTGALSGAETYTNTGSPAAGVLSGITAAALPGITGGIERAVLRGLGAEAVSGPIATSWENRALGQGISGPLERIPLQVQAANQLYDNFAQRLGSNLAGQAGAAGIMEASGLGQDYLAGQPLHDPFSAETALNLTLGQLPFAALHLGAKALRLGKTQEQQRSEFQQQIDLTNKGLERKAIVDAERNKTNFEKLPDLTPEQRVARDQQTVDETNAILEVLGVRRQEIEANPSELNIEELGKIADEEKTAVDEAITKNGGVGLGLSNASGAKLDVVGTDHFYKESTGYHVITIADDPKNTGLTYPDGTPVNPGDRVGFPGGNYDPAINQDASPNFQLPKGKFTKVIDRPATKPEGQQTPELPVQATAYDLEQLHQHVSDLEKIKQIVSSPGMTWGGAVSALEQVNQIRKELGRPEIDLASLRIHAEKVDLTEAPDALNSLVAETSRTATIEAESKADLLKRMADETKTQAGVFADAQMGDQTAKAVLDLYNELSSKESGRRDSFVVNSDGSSPFWKKVGEMQKAGNLNPKALRDAAENVAPQGANLPKPKLVEKQDLEKPVFKALTSEEVALHQIGAERILKVLAGDNSDEAKVFKQVFIDEAGNGDFKPTREVFAEAAVKAGVEDEGPGANLYAEGFVKNPKVVEWVRQLKQLQIENAMPAKAKAPDEQVNNSQVPLTGSPETLEEVNKGLIHPNDVEVLDRARRVTALVGKEYGIEDKIGTPVTIRPKARPFGDTAGSYQVGGGRITLEIRTRARKDFGGQWFKSRHSDSDIIDTIAHELAHENVPNSEGPKLREEIARIKLLVENAWKNDLEKSRTAKAPNEPQQIPAGGGFVWGLAPYDEATNKLGGKHTLPKSGVISKQQLKAIGGRGKPLQDVEIEMMKAVDQAVGGKAFEGGNVNVRELVKELKDNPVQVEVKKLGSESSDFSIKRQRYGQLQHELETLVPNFIQHTDAMMEKQTPEIQAKYDEYRKLGQELTTTQHITGERGAKFAFVAPKAESEMPGYVEGLVRIPFKQVTGPKGGRVTTPLHFDGPHFGREDKNVLAFFRGFEETLPTGEKVFHVIEVQSDWGQQGLEIKKGNDPDSPFELVTKKGRLLGKFDTEEQAKKSLESKGHPLLPVYETLALKAAVDHAKSIGATKIFLPDAETAMMTEGHDKAAIPHYNDPDFPEPHPRRMTAEMALDLIRQGRRDEVAYTVTQEGGMKLHYDTTLPSAMRKLTGDMGVKVEGGGEHKAGHQFSLDSLMEQGLTREEALRNQAKNPAGSPVFKDTQGNPKTQISGTVYDLSKIQDISNRQGGLTLGDPARAPAEPYIPVSEKSRILAEQLTTDGTGLAKLVASEDSSQGALARDLLKLYPTALSGIKSAVEDIKGLGYYTAGKINKISFGPGVLDQAPANRNFSILHELIHGLTMNVMQGLGADHPLIKQLEELRQKAIESLPKEMRELHEKAIRENFYAKFETTDDYRKLAPTEVQRSVLYALQNLDEFVTQGHSDVDFQRFLQKIPGKSGLWTRFVNWTKAILGTGIKIEDTALAELMDVGGQLMDRGEYLASVKEFGERYFEARGRGGKYGQVQTQRGLGLILDHGKGTSTEELVSWLTKNHLNENYNQGLWDTGLKLQSILKENGEEAQGISSVLSEVGFGNVDDMVDSAIGDGKRIQDEMDLMSPAAASYIFEKLKDHRDVLAMVSEATKSGNEGILNVENPTVFRKPVTRAIKNIDRILVNRDRQIEMAGHLVGLQAIEPEGLVSAMAKAPGIVNDFVDGAKDAVDGTGSWLARFFEPMGQYVRRIPQAAELVSKGFQLVSNARTDFADRIKAFGTDNSSPFINPNPTHDSIKQTEKVLSTPKLLRAVDQWMHLNNKLGGDAVKLLPETHPEVAKILNKLSKDEQAQVRDILVKQGISTQTGHAKNLESMTQIAATDGGGVLLHEIGGKTKDAISLSDTLLRAILKTKDPLTQWAGQAEIQAVQAKMTPLAFLSLLKYSQASADKIGMWKEFYDKNPFWATAQRMERYLVNGFKNGKPKLLQASSIKEGRDIAEKAGLTLDKNEPFTDQWKGREDEPFQFPNLSPEMVQKMRQSEEIQIGILKNAEILVTDEDVAKFRESSTVSQTVREATADASIPGVTPPPRRLSKGSEDLPWMWNHISHAQKESTYWSRKLLRAQARTYLLDSELANMPDVRERLKTHVENLLQPDPQAAQKMTRFASVWFMGFNLASSMVNMSQPFVTHVAELTSMTGRPLDSYRRVLAALKDAGINQFKKTKQWANADESRFMEDAARDGERTLSMFDDDAAAQEAMDTNFKRAMMKNKPQTIGQQMGEASGIYTKAAMWPFRVGEQINATTALLTGFRLAREQGLGYEDARQKAYEFNRAVNFSGGRAQRPVGFFSGRGPTLRTAAMLGASLQSYVLGTTAQIGRYLQIGLFRPQGVTPHEVYAARRAGLQMLGTQLFAAGILGLPFASGALSLLNQLFPDLEVNKKVREGMNSFLSSDQENGATLTDIAMTGVPSMLGWDLQSRLSMGNTLPGVSEVNGFQPENLMGPSANIVRNFVSGVQGWSKGDAKAGMKFLPSGAKSLIQTGANLLSGEDAIRDYQGRPLNAPTLGEKIGLSMGFQPKRLSDQNAASRIANQASEVSNRQEGQQREDFAREVLKGNFGNVRQAIIERAQNDKQYNPQDAVRAVARAAEEQTFPRDLRREGNLNTSNSRASFLNSFSNLSSTPTEESRFLFRQQIEQRLGLPPIRSGQELELARMVDKLRLAQPNASRAELRAAAQSALRRSAGARSMLTSLVE